MDESIVLQIKKCMKTMSSLKQMHYSTEINQPAQNAMSAGYENYSNVPFKAYSAQYLLLQIKSEEEMRDFKVNISIRSRDWVNEQ
jgi:hypothetical protein